MRRSITTLGAISLAAALAIGAPRPSQADTWQELTGLANIFPINTDVYIGVRTDDAFIETLDGLVARIESALPTQMNQTLSDALDSAARSIDPNGSFEDTLRPILGDEAAFAISDIAVLYDDKPGNDDTANYAFAISLNEGGAELLNARIAAAMPTNGRYTTTGEGDGITLYTPSGNNERSGQQLIYVSQTEAVVTNSRVMLPISREARLASNPALGEALDRLPQDDYNVVVYIDVANVMNSMMGMLDEQDNEMSEQLQQQMEQMQGLMGAIGPQAWGFTIVDDRSLMIDISQSVNMEAYASLGVPMNTMTTPVDPAFLEHLPAGSALVVHSAGFGASLSAIDEAFAQMQTPDSEQMIQQLNFMLRAATGQNLDEIATWTTGDFAAVTTPLAGLSDPGFMRTGQTEDGRIPVDFGVVVGTSDAAAAQLFARNIANSLGAMADPEDDTRVSVTQETIEGVEVQVVTATTEDPSLIIEILMGANDQVFALGTRTVVTAALDSAPDLAADPTLLEAQTYSLPNPVSFLYLAGEPLTPLLNLILGVSGSNTGNADVLANLVSSATISATANENGDALVRLVWTLPAATAR